MPANPIWKPVARVCAFALLVFGLSACPNSTNRVPITQGNRDSAKNARLKKQGGEASLTPVASAACLSLSNLGTELSKSKDARAFILTTLNVEVGTRASASSTADFVPSTDAVLRGQVLKANVPAYDVASAGKTDNFMAADHMNGLLAVNSQADDCSKVTFGDASGGHQDFSVVSHKAGQLTLANDGEIRTYTFTNQSELQITVTKPAGGDLKPCSSADAGTPLFVKTTYAVTWDGKNDGVSMTKDYMTALTQHLDVEGLKELVASAGASPTVDLDYGQYVNLRDAISKATFQGNDCK